MRLLQIFSFKTSVYERPNQKWVCGRASCGDPCLAGPDLHGRCQATCECRPLKKGDQWYCTRPASLGGPCDGGPLPNGQCCRPVPKCQPVRNLRTWRGLIVLMVVATTTSALLLALTLDPEAGQALVSPGALSFQHSTYKSECSDCHVNAQSKTVPINWLRSPVTAESRLADSQACLKCHNLGAQSFAIHALPPALLDEATRRALQRKVSPDRPLPLLAGAMLGGNPKYHESAWACDTCHTEHLGKKNDLIRLTDLQCQSCHAVQFASFSRGHPPFAGYPFRRRTRIEFDHRAHVQIHFKEEQFARLAPATCSGCHAPDPKGSAMLVKSFDETCAACHADQIKGKGRAAGPGIAVIRLPGLDVQTLTNHGIMIGDWPEGADGNITPFMQSLLASNVVPEGDLLDMSKASDATLNHAADLAWSIKELIYDLSAKGHTEIEGRLREALHGELSSRQSAAVAGLLSADVIQALRNKWFPNLDVEIARHRAGGKLPPPSTNNAAPAAALPGRETVKPEEWVARGGWYRSDLDYSLSYRPTGHADSFLQNWLDLTVAPPEARKLFDSLSSAGTPGLCAKCHSVDREPQWQVNWRGFQPDPYEHRFTHFSHTAHFSLMDNHGCQTCHSLDLNAPRESYSATFSRENRDPSVFRSNFSPIRLSMCASCHTQKYAGEGCLECHNYHVGHFMPTLPRQQWARPQSGPNP
jgi:hypothetical protein